MRASLIRKRVSLTSLAVIVTALSILWIGIVFFAGLEPVKLLGPPFVIVGLAILAAGIVRLRDPGWQNNGWWADHPTISFIVGGPALSGRRGTRGHEAFSGAMQGFVGLALVLAGTLMIIPT
jgi:hypothetical protein